MSDCGCKGKPVAQHDDEAVWETCDFEDSLILKGQFWPRRQVHPLVLPANTIRRISSLSDVAQSMYVTVLSGDLAMWFESNAGEFSSTGDQIHMLWGTGGTQEAVILPPGLNRMVFIGDNSAACTATVVIMDREAHQGSAEGNR